MSKITIPIEINSKELKSPLDLNDGDRLFYELGYYKNFINGKWYDWTPTGEFKEIENSKEFLDEEDRISNKDFIKHHNFMIVSENDINEKLTI